MSQTARSFARAAAASFHPPPRQLTSLLVKSPCAQTLVRAGDSHAAAFNAVHCSAFWVALGRLARDSPEQRQWLHAQPTALDPARDTTLRLLSTFKPRELASTACGAAHAGVGSKGHWPPFWSSLAAAAEPVLRDFRSLELKELAWAFSKAGAAQAGAIPPPTLDALALEAGERIEDLQSDEVAMLAWSFATSGHKSEEATRLLSGLAAAAAASDLHTFAPTELATAAWAFGKAELGIASAGFYRALATHLPERIQQGSRASPSLPASSVAMIAWGIGKAGHATPALLEELAVAARRHDLSAYNPRSLSNLATAYLMCEKGPLEEKGLSLIASISSHCAKPQALNAFQPPELISLARGYADAISAGRIDAPPKLFSAIASRALQCLPQCGERELSLLPWALIHAHSRAQPSDKGSSSKGYKHKPPLPSEAHQLFQAVAYESAPRLVEFKHEGLVALTWSYERYLKFFAPRQEAPSDAPSTGQTLDGEPEAAPVRKQALPVQEDEASAQLLDALSEELGGRRTELSAHDATTAESCFIRLGRPSPFGNRDQSSFLREEMDE